MMFTRLSELRAQLAAIPSVKVDAETRAAIVNAIDALDDAMVAEARADEVAKICNCSRNTVHQSVTYFRRQMLKELTEGSRPSGIKPHG